MDSVVVFVDGATVIPCADFPEDALLALELGVRAVRARLS